MGNYEGTYKGICSYNLMSNFLIKLLAITNFSFCGALFKCILAWERDISNFQLVLRMKLFLPL